jgi:nucleoside-diphosphate-sugar epimerase
MATNRLVLLTGATGYIRGGLLKALEAQGRHVRCLARQPEFLRERVAGNTEIVAGEVLDSVSLDRAMSGVDTAFYLVHSMQRASDFWEEDRQAAQNFGAAARAAGVGRVIASGQADLIAFGRPYLSNPDLVERFANGWELNPPAEMTVWSAPTAQGYTNFPFHPRASDCRSGEKLPAVLDS